jgi:hypothetical protein
MNFECLPLAFNESQRGLLVAAVRMDLFGARWWQYLKNYIVATPDDTVVHINFQWNFVTPTTTYSLLY